MQYRTGSVASHAVVDSRTRVLAQLQISNRSGFPLEVASCAKILLLVNRPAKIGGILDSEGGYLGLQQHLDHLGQWTDT